MTESIELKKLIRFVHNWEWKRESGQMDEKADLQSDRVI